MKTFVIFSLFLVSKFHQNVAETQTYPSPNYADAVDAIEQPKYRQAFKKMFPHLNYDDVPLSKSPKIINGDVANFGDFPYQVLNYMTANNINWYTCGGILIARQWVLTAGHCVFEFTFFELYFGLIQRPPSDYAWATSVTGSQNIHLHEKYDDEVLANDIAMIFLSNAPSDFLQLPNVGVIPLPSEADADVNLVGVVGSVSGFGRTSDTSSASNVLMNTTAPIMANAQCALTFGPLILSSNLCLNTLNAGSACSGDSGGPLTAEIQSNRRVLVGIVSFGAASGCTLGYPDVYTRITSYLDWIENIIDPREPSDGNCNCICNCFTCPAGI